MAQSWLTGAAQGRGTAIFFLINGIFAGGRYQIKGRTNTGERNLFHPAARVTARPPFARACKWYLKRFNTVSAESNVSVHDDSRLMSYLSARSVSEHFSRSCFVIATYRVLLLFFCHLSFLCHLGLSFSCHFFCQLVVHSFFGTRHLRQSQKMSKITGFLEFCLIFGSFSCIFSAISRFIGTVRLRQSLKMSKTCSFPRVFVIFWSSFCNFSVSSPFFLARHLWQSLKSSKIAVFLEFLSLFGNSLVILLSFFRHFSFSWNPAYAAQPEDGENRTCS